MNTNSPVTSLPVARGGLTIDRTLNGGRDLPLAQPATYDAASANEAEAWEHAGREGERGDIPLLAPVSTLVLICFVRLDAPSALKRDP